MGEMVRAQAAGPVLLITLDRPEKRNAISAEITHGLDAAFHRLETNPELRVAVLAAQGEFFSAGSDLVSGAGPHTPEGGQYGMIRRARTKPLVAAVEGPALGGGFEMVLAADLVVASSAAWFALPETTRGRVPAAGGLFRAPDRLPRNVAVELMLTGGRLGAERAWSLGLVNRLVESGEALSTALDLALDICDSSPAATEQLLRALHAVDAGAEETGWTTTAAAMAVLLESEDRAEGSLAFVEKRPPGWAPGTEARAATRYGLLGDES